MRDLFRALRPGHWTKNVLVFVPLALGHRWGDAAAWIGCLVAFVSLSMAASAGYLVNDLKDMANDRSHPTKRHRPFASGRLAPSIGYAAAALLALTALILAIGGHSPRLGVIVAVYLVATIAYSTWLKREVILDVGVLACLYMLRIFAGGTGAEVVLSPWLLTFSALFFLSLALAKRHVELRRRAAESTLPGRGYQAGDWPFTLSAGLGAAFAAVVIYFIYLSSSPAAAEYGNANALWPIAGVLLTWLGRVWLFAHRGELAYDPVEYAFRDAPSRFLGILAAGLFFFAV